MTATELLSAVVGPVGALVLALIILYIVARVVQVLWQKHLEADEDDRNQRDAAQALLRTALDNNAAAISAWNKRNELDAARQRRGDR